MRARFVFTATLAGVGLVVSAQPPAGSGSEAPWSAVQVLHSEDLARLLSNKQAAQPQMYQVGFAVLYKSKHIPGSVYAGPGSKDAGLEDLKKAVAALPRDRQIVLYCGCCPWDQCPNMKPAFKLLQSMGFKQVKVLEIPTNFAKDWVEKGFPVEGPAADASAH